MKLTNDKVFLDTNVIVYAHTDLDPVKQTIAQSIIIENNSILSTQVLQELANTLSRKFKHSWDSILNVITDCTGNNDIYINSESTIVNAMKLAERYGYSFYDCMIISAALATKCEVLYSEDMQNGHFINDKLTIRNPFL